MTASKYSRLARVSKATATRHLVDLAQKGALVSEGQGKTTRYQIRLDRSHVQSTNAALIKARTCCRKARDST